MTFVHPLILLASVAVAAPILVHYLTRPRPVRLPLSTIRFVIQAVNQRRARHRLRDLLILLLRAAAVALLVYAFARPLFGQKPLISPADPAAGVRVVLLDQSASMAAVSGGATAFDKARAVAAEYLQTSAASRANLILAAAAPRAVFDAPSANVGALRDELARAAPLPQRANAQAAINLARDMLAKAPPDARRELVIVSDFQRADWAAADFSPLPADTKIELKAVAPPDRANVGLLRVGAAASARAEQGRELRVEAEVGNFSPTPRDVQVELTVGPNTHRLSGLCAPWTTTTLATTITPAAAGWQTGKARLLNVDDALPLDAERHFALDVRPSPTYLLVTREPAKPAPTSSHFVERALAPNATPAAANARPATAAKILRITPDKLDRDALAAADLIVLDHPGKLPQPAANLLAGMMRRGRAVLYLAAEPLDATNLRLIADAAGSDMKMPVEFAPPPAGQSRRGLFLADLRKDEPPFAAFGESLPAATAGLRFAGGLASRRLDGGLLDDVLASYGDRSAALVATACGAGALGVLNADLSLSNLPQSQTFVPLLTELVARLTGSRGDAASVACGEPAALALPPDAGAAAGLTLDPADDAGQLAEENNLVAWRWNPAARPGVYQVKRAGQTVYAVAATLPRDESDLRTIDAATVPRLAAGHQIHFDPNTAATNEEPKDQAWSWALVACAACMTLELFTLKAFRT